MSKAKEKVKRFWDEHGDAIVEFGVITAMVMGVYFIGERTGRKIACLEGNYGLAMLCKEDPAIEEHMEAAALKLKAKYNK